MNNIMEKFKKLGTEVKTLIIVVAVIIVVAIIGSINSVINPKENKAEENTSTTNIVGNISSNENIVISEEKSKTEEEEKAETEQYKKDCVTVDWKSLCREPEKYKGNKICVTGKVAQIMTGGWFTSGGFRLYEDYELTAGGTYLSKEWYISADLDNFSPKILKDDVIKIYGEFGGVEEVTRALTGTKDSVPTLTVKYIDLIKG